MFDKAYYDTIWPDQGVHRHDYCQDLARRLVNEHGKVRFLDIGTGCGYLVQCLRQLGAEAWGLEVSEYAVANSHGYVRQGDVRSIPWAADSFDVVFSQGLWGYFPKEEVQKAWAECKRVGRVQSHNIDYNDYDPDHQYVFTETEQWWRDQFYPKILIGCPNHECKEYSFQAWIDRVKELTYPNYDVLVVDNSPTTEFMERWQNQVPMEYIKTHPDDLATKRINLSMEVLRQTTLAGGYAHFFCLESDVIPPKDVVETLLKWGRDSDWISHAYPIRGANDGVDFQQGIGCSLFSRTLIEAFGFADIDDGYYSDAGLWEKVRRSKMQTMELWGYMQMQHLGEA